MATTKQKVICIESTGRFYDYEEHKTQNINDLLEDWKVVNMAATNGHCFVTLEKEVC